MQDCHQIHPSVAHLTVDLEDTVCRSACAP